MGEKKKIAERKFTEINQLLAKKRKRLQDEVKGKTYNKMKIIDGEVERAQNEIKIMEGEVAQKKNEIKNKKEEIAKKEEEITKKEEEIAKKAEEIMQGNKRKESLKKF